MHFKDKVIVITGASSGIGKALSLQLMEQGAKVAVCARNLPKLQEAFTGFHNNNLLMEAADVSSEEDCKRFIEKVVQHWGKIDVLVNNAGISMRALFEDLDLKVIRELMDINFWGTVYMSKFSLPYIMAAKGTIIGISSIAGYRGLPARTGYSSSKFAMQGFLEALRTELLYSGVHVMWVSPGFTASNIRNTALSASGAAQSETPLEENKLMSAETCATHIIKAIQSRKRTLVITTQGKMAVWLNKLIPSFVDQKVYKLFLKEPDSPLLKYHPKT